MHEMELPENLKVIARAGAGVNNIPLDKCAEKGIVVFNTPGANANGVKELVLAGLLLASRDIIGGVNWVQSERQNEDIAKMAEKAEKEIRRMRVKGQKAGCHRSWSHRCSGGKRSSELLDMEVYGYDPYISVDAAWKLSRNIKHINDVK